MFAVSINEFEEWLQVAGRGDSLVYASSPFLGGDSLPPEINAAAGAAQKAYQNGLVNLVQRRLTPSPGTFDYIAQRK